MSHHYLEIKHESPHWYGDLDDDCFSKWMELLLHAEWMDGEGPDAYWWWAVYVMKTSEEFDSSHNHISPPNSGEGARKCAEAAARRYFEKIYSDIFRHID